MKGIEVALVGRITKEAQIRTSSGGREWMSLSVVVGEEPDEQWVSVASWSHTTAELQPHLVGGAEVYIEGKLKLRSWEDAASGERKTGISVSASLIQPMALIGNKKPKRPRAEAKAKGAMSEAVDKPLPFHSDDIGF